MTARSAWLAVAASALLCILFYVASLRSVERAEARVLIAEDRAVKAERAYEYSKWLAWEQGANSRMYELAVDDANKWCAYVLAVPNEEWERWSALTPSERRRELGMELNRGTTR